MQAHPLDATVHELMCTRLLYLPDGGLAREWPDSDDVHLTRYQAEAEAFREAVIAGGTIELVCASVSRHPTNRHLAQVARDLLTALMHSPAGRQRLTTTPGAAACLAPGAPTSCCTIW